MCYVYIARVIQWYSLCLVHVFWGKQSHLATVWNLYSEWIGCIPFMETWTITRIITSHLFISWWALWRSKVTGSPWVYLVHVTVYYWCRGPNTGDGPGGGQSESRWGLKSSAAPFVLSLFNHGPPPPAWRRSALLYIYISDHGWILPTQD